jgi:enoyl-CoA hydratase/carnithine racemase
MLERQREGAVGLLRIDRQAVRNALDAALTAQLARAFAEIATDDGVRAVVLAGKGAGFCAGSDLKEMRSVTPGRRLEIAREKAALLRTMAGLPKPVVAAVNGFALGGGMMLAAACDVVVTSRDARWRLPEVGLGFFPPWGLEALVARVGVSRARYLVLGHEQLDGARALELGLADVCVAPGAADAEALAHAARLAQLPPAAVAVTKRYFERLVKAGDLDALAAEAYRAG